MSNWYNKICVHSRLHFPSQKIEIRSCFTVFQERNKVFESTAGGATFYRPTQLTNVVRGHVTGRPAGESKPRSCQQVCILTKVKMLLSTKTTWRGWLYFYTSSKSCTSTFKHSSCIYINDCRYTIISNHFLTLKFSKKMIFPKTS